MNAEQFRYSVGLISDKPDFPCMEMIKCRKMILDRISDLEQSLAVDNEKARAVYKIHEWENLKARVYYSRLNLELNRQLLANLK